MTERELLLEYRPWLRRCAASMTSPSRAEDLAQEGWIALWRALDTYDGSAPLDWWLKRKAHGRMLTLVQRDWNTAKATQDVPWGHPMPGIDRSAMEAKVKGEDPIWDQLAVDLGNIELAYHRGEIYAALDRLTPREREYVFLRFWCGWKQPQMVAHFGYAPNGLWRTSKIKLTEHLAHLEPLTHG